MLDPESLLQKIEELRKTLQSRFGELGEVTDEILRLSRELDVLIVEYHRRFGSNPPDTPE